MPLRQLNVTYIELLHPPRQRLAFNNVGRMLARTAQKAEGGRVRGTGISVNQRMQTLSALADEIRAYTRDYHDKNDQAPATHKTITELLDHAEG